MYRLIYVQEQITQCSNSGLNHLVENIRAHRQIRLTDHAVSLGDTGESAEGQEDQDRVKKRLTGIVNSTCYFQNTPVYVQQFCIGMAKRHEDDVKQIKKNHIAS